MRILEALVFTFFLFLSSEVAAEPTTHQILTRADEARGNIEGVTWEVTILSLEDDHEKDMTFDVQAKGFDLLAKALSPAKQKGNKLLMASGNMWFHKPGLSKPAPISQRQRLLGNAAYGDIASTNYAEDYVATVLGDGSDTSDTIINGQICYVYDLKARTKKATYDRIKYWVSKEKLVGLKAEYFTVSNKKFKSAIMEYENEVKADGKPRPFISRVTIYDELMSENVTTLTFSEPAIKRIPRHIFNLNLLTRQ